MGDGLTSTYGTLSELEFIDKLGKCSEKKFSRKKLLEGYIEGALKRENWGKVDRRIAISHAQGRLVEVERNGR